MKQFGKWKVAHPETQRLKKAGGHVLFVQNVESDNDDLFVLKKKRPTSTSTQYKDGQPVGEVPTHTHKQFVREVETLASMDHPGIAKVVDYDLEHNPPYFVTEYCSGGTLREADLKNWTMKEKLICYHKMCDAFGYLWEKGYSKSDHNFKNIFLKEDGRTPVLGDFEYVNKIERSADLIKQILIDMGAIFWELMEAREWSQVFSEEMRINREIKELTDQKGELQKQLERLEGERDELFTSFS